MKELFDFIKYFIKIKFIRKNLGLCIFLLEWSTILTGLGFTVLGIGCIAWSMFSIWEQHQYYPGVDLQLNKIITRGYTLEDINVESDYSPVISPPDKILYPVYPKAGENIGSLTIPALKRKVSIFQSTNEIKLSEPGRE